MTCLFPKMQPIAPTRFAPSAAALEPRHFSPNFRQSRDRPRRRRRRTWLWACSMRVLSIFSRGRCRACFYPRGGGVAALPPTRGVLFPGVAAPKESAGCSPELLPLALRVDSVWGERCVYWREGCLFCRVTAALAAGRTRIFWLDKSGFATRAGFLRDSVRWLRRPTPSTRGQNRSLHRDSTKALDEARARPRVELPHDV